MEVSTGLMYLLYRRSAEQSQIQREQLNLLRAHQGLPPIQGPGNTPMGQALNRASYGAWCGVCAGSLAPFVSFAFVVLVTAALNISAPGPFTLEPDNVPEPLFWGAAAYGLYKGLQWGWRLGAALDRGL